MIINPIILDALESYFQEKPEVPSEMKDLIKKLLDCETHEHVTKEGMDKLYDQILERFIENDSLVEWSSKYVS